MVKVLLILLPLLFNINAHAKYNCISELQQYLVKKVYTITLCKESEISYEKLYDSTFSIELEYHMNSTSKWISKRSIFEIQKHYSITKQEKEKYLQSMLKIFPNVKKGDKIKMNYNQGGLLFYYNNKPIGEIKDPKFAKIFADIWLHPNATFQKTRNLLFSNAQ